MSRVPSYSVFQEALTQVFKTPLNQYNDQPAKLVPTLSVSQDSSGEFILIDLRLFNHGRVGLTWNIPSLDDLEFSCSHCKNNLRIKYHSSDSSSATRHSFSLFDSSSSSSSFYFANDSSACWNVIACDREPPVLPKVSLETQPYMSHRTTFIVCTSRASGQTRQCPYFDSDECWQSHAITIKYNIPAFTHAFNSILTHDQEYLGLVNVPCFKGYCELQDAIIAEIEKTQKFEALRFLHKHELYLFPQEASATISSWQSKRVRCFDLFSKLPFVFLFLLALYFCSWIFL